ncbi:MAG: S8 family serine peptidase [Planctomycetota bacterium]
MFLRLLSVSCRTGADGRQSGVLKAALVSVLLLTGLITTGFAEQNQKTEPGLFEYTGTYQLRRIDPNLTGSGIRFAVISRSMTYVDGYPQNDYRPHTDHQSFDGSNVTFHDDGRLSSGVSAHCTAVLSILIGDDANASYPELGRFYYEGAAPDSQVDVYEFWHFAANNIYSALSPGADIITMSIGWQFEDWWTRGLESIAEHSGTLVIAGIGNGTNAYDSVLYPGACSNVLGVGVVSAAESNNVELTLRHFGLSSPANTSCGPTDNRRAKPDIVAPGNCLVADTNSFDRYRITGSWSSFATPVVAGTAALLLQKTKSEPDLDEAIGTGYRNCLIRTVLMNSAVKLPYWHKGQVSPADDHSVPLDYAQGAGVLNAVGAYEQLVAGRMEPGRVRARGWDKNCLDEEKNPQNIYSFSVNQEDHNGFLCTTLVWNRHFQQQYPFASTGEDDDLRLELWAVDINQPENDILLDYSDSNTDNLEHIYFALDPNYTDYEIVVSFGSAADANYTEKSECYVLAWNIARQSAYEQILWYDFNFDGIVDDADFSIILENVVDAMNGSDDYLLGDINLDGRIDLQDMEIVISAKALKAQWYQ